MSDGISDVLRVDGSDLIVQTPDTDAFNSTLNVSLACLTELARGTRNSTDLAACLRYTLSVLSLRDLRVYFWPFRVHWPWESPEEADVVGYGASAAAPGGAAMAPHVGDDDDDDDDHHYYDHHYDYYYATGYELVFVFFFLSAILLVCGFVVADTYGYDADGQTEWRYDGGVYRRVKVVADPTTPDAARAARGSRPRDATEL